VKCFVSLQFLNPRTVSTTPWTGDQPVAMPLPIQGFESTIPVFERAKAVHALGRAATVIGFIIYIKKRENINWFAWS
jgi:hypothetical protein